MKFIWFILFLTIVDGKIPFKKKKATVAPAPGIWQEWSEWGNCSKTCGVGIRRRTRPCSYTGKKRKGRCKGPSGQIMKCDTMTTCPVHGEWSVWTAEECSVSCGGGTGSMKRTCTNPRPMFEGRNCEGPARKNGECNLQLCPDQVYTLTPEITLSLQEAIQKQHHDIEANEGSDAAMFCGNSNTLSAIYQHYPSTVLLWTRNGLVFSLDSGRMRASISELSIKNLRPNDTGVYQCSVQYAPEVVKPLAVAALSVKPKEPNVLIHEGAKLTLVCNGVHLGKLFKHLSQTWFFNGLEFKQFGNKSVFKSNKIKIQNVQRSMTGLWTCKIKNLISNKWWTTNIFRMKVLPPVPRIRNFPLGHLFVISSTILFVIIVLTIFVLHKISKARKEFIVHFGMWSDIMKDGNYFPKTAIYLNTMNSVDGFSSYPESLSEN